MKFELTRLSGYSDDDILAEIRRVAALLNIDPLSITEFNKHSRVSPNTIKRRFGGWKEGLERAGLNHLYGGPPITDRMRAQLGKYFEDIDLLAELRRISEVVGREDLVTHDIEKHSAVDKVIFSRRFGSFHNALMKAGLNSRPLGRRYTDEECFENLYEVWKHYGRQPTVKEMNCEPSKVGAKAYLKRFNGKWLLALAAFVDRVNQENGPEATEPANHASALKALKPVLAKEDKRDIPLGLRFRVLTRDRFKCILCGDHPARNPDCVLHVDHILPWSKEGKTIEINLRTLCATCNIGRGNRYID